MNILWLNSFVTETFSDTSVENLIKKITKKNGVPRSTPMPTWAPASLCARGGVRCGSARAPTWHAMVATSCGSGGWHTWGLGLDEVRLCRRGAGAAS